jgi:hypothetical protein
MISHYGYHGNIVPGHHCDNGTLVIIGTAEIQLLVVVAMETHKNYYDNPYSPLLA